jgi:biotin carboxyl carrier protein
MSDKRYTLEGGESFEAQRLPGDGIELSGKKPSRHFSACERHCIDAETTRLLSTFEDSKKLYWVYARGNSRILSWPGGSIRLEAGELSEGSGSGGGSLKPLKLTMPGKVLSIKVKEGQVVESGSGLVIVEAMKMENLLLAPGKARIEKIHVKEGDRLESGALLITFGEA